MDREELERKVLKTFSKRVTEGMVISKSFPRQVNLQNNLSQEWFNRERTLKIAMK